MTLKISNYKLHHPINQNILIDDLNLVTEYGDIIGIIGPNGSGKTLFLDSIAQLNTAWQGNISLENKNIDINSISYFVQGLQNNFFSETVEDEIKYHLENIDTSFILEQVITDLNSLGFDYDNLKELSPFALSNIENKILSFILSFLKPHNVRLIDELDSGMTLERKVRLSQFINNCRENKITLIVSHDNTFLDHLCNNVIHF